MEADPGTVAVRKGALEVCSQLGAVDKFVQGLQGTHQLTLPRKVFTGHGHGRSPQEKPLEWLTPGKTAGLLG